MYVCRYVVMLHSFPPFKKSLKYDTIYLSIYLSSWKPRALSRNKHLCLSKKLKTKKNLQFFLHFIFLLFTKFEKKIVDLEISTVYDFRRIIDGDKVKDEHFELYRTR